MSTSVPAAMRTWRSSDIACLPRTTGLCAARDIDHVRVTGGGQLVARLLASAAGPADDIQRCSVSTSRQFGGVQAVERYVAGEVDMHFAVFHWCANVDQLDALVHLLEIKQLLGRNGCGGHDSLLLNR